MYLSKFINSYHLPVTLTGVIVLILLTHTISDFQQREEFHWSHYKMFFF